MVPFAPEQQQGRQKVENAHVHGMGVNGKKRNIGGTVLTVMFSQEPTA